ncbi:MAG: diguanylate cyclase [Desulfobacterales bacterium]|nr:diguanylate cyclase [Desulfobacterales bacterium]
MNNSSHEYYEIACAQVGESPTTILDTVRKGIDAAIVEDNPHLLILFHKLAGETLSRIGCQDKALMHWNAAVDRMDTQDVSPDLRANVLVLIGEVYESVSDHKRAFDYYAQARFLYEKCEDRNGLADCAYRTGRMSLKKGDLHDAIECLMEADSLYEKKTANADHLLLKGKVYGQLGAIHVKLFNYDEAIHYFFQSLEEYNLYDYSEGLVDIMNHIGQTYLAKGLYFKAQTFLLDGYEHSIELKDQVLQRRFTSNLSELYEKMGDYKGALSYLKKAYALNESNFSKTLNQKISDIHMRNEIERKEKEIELYKLKNNDLKRTNTIIKSQNDALQVAYNKMEVFAQTDPLTGLDNRRKMYDSIRGEMARYKRHSQTFSFVLLDVDNFKIFNDTYGHNTGDIALKALANLLKSQIRDQDVACRWGGEEFLLMLPETDMDGAIQLAEKLRKAIEQLEIEYDNEEILHVTATLGVSSFTESDRHADEIITRADQALYEGKKTGRNKVCVDSAHAAN